MSEFSRAARELLALDGRPQPEDIAERTLLAALDASPWTRFAVGVDRGEPVPAGKNAELAAPAHEFAQQWEMWMGYRRSIIELRPPGQAPLAFTIDPEVGGDPPADFPASTFAVITAWNPGRGEPRPDNRANHRANERLAKQLDARLYERWPATNGLGTRLAEESFCVLGIELDEAWRTAEAFQQRAVYYIDRGRPLLVSRRRGRVVAWEGEIRRVK